MKKTVLAILVLLASVSIVYATLNYQKVIPCTGTVKTVGVDAYWDEACTDVVDTIDWGILEPGSSRNVVLYLRNEGNAAITLSLTTENWSPAEASIYITVSWSYDGSQIQPNESKPTTLTLTVSGSISGISSFTLDVIITGQG